MTFPENCNGCDVLQHANKKLKVEVERLRECCIKYEERKATVYPEDTSFKDIIIKLRAEVEAVQEWFKNEFPFYHSRPIDRWSYDKLFKILNSEGGK